jgi:hypothetical protein
MKTRLDYFAAFVEAYTLCALWASTNFDDKQERSFSDCGYSPSDLSDECREKIRKKCEDFLTTYVESRNISITWEDGDYRQAGHDFFLSSNGHGAGFFDGYWGVFGDYLQKSARTYNSDDFYVVDKMIYL